MITNNNGFHIETEVRDNFAYAYVTEIETTLIYEASEPIYSDRIAEARSKAVQSAIKKAQQGYNHTFICERYRLKMNIYSSIFVRIICTQTKDVFENASVDLLKDESSFVRAVRQAYKCANKGKLSSPENLIEKPIQEIFLDSTFTVERKEAHLMASIYLTHKASGKSFESIAFYESHESKFSGNQYAFYSVCEAARHAKLINI